MDSEGEELDMNNSPAQPSKWILPESQDTTARVQTAGNMQPWEKGLSSYQAYSHSHQIFLLDELFCILLATLPEEILREVGICNPTDSV